MESQISEPQVQRLILFERRRGATGSRIVFPHLI